MANSGGILSLVVAEQVAFALQVGCSVEVGESHCELYSACWI